MKHIFAPIWYHPLPHPKIITPTLSNFHDNTYTEHNELRAGLQGDHHFSHKKSGNNPDLTVR